MTYTLVGLKRSQKEVLFMKEIRQRKILGRNVFLYEAILEKVMYFVKYSNMISNMEMIVH